MQNCTRLEATEVILPGPETASALQVQLPGGISLQVADAHQARLAAQLYGVHKTMHEARRRHLRCTRKQEADGTIKLTLHGA